MTYIDPGIGHLTDFKTHLERVLRLPETICLALRFIYAGPSTIFCRKGREALSRRRSNLRPGSFPRNLLATSLYVRHGTRSDTATLNNSDIEFLNHAKQCFAGEPFESAYKKWQIGHAQRKAIGCGNRKPFASQAGSRSFEPACSLVTILRSARTRKSPENRA